MRKDLVITRKYVVLTRKDLVITRKYVVLTRKDLVITIKYGILTRKAEADLGFFRSRGHNGATIYREGPSLPFKSLETLTIPA